MTGGLQAINFPDDTSITDADLTQLIRLTTLRQLNLHDPASLTLASPASKT